MNQIAWIYSR